MKTSTHTSTVFHRSLAVLMTMLIPVCASGFAQNAGSENVKQSEPIRPITSTPEDEAKADKIIADTVVLQYQFEKKKEGFNSIKKFTRSDLVALYYYIKNGIPQEQEAIKKMKDYLMAANQSGRSNPEKQAIIQEFLTSYETDIKGCSDLLTKLDGELNRSEASEVVALANQPVKEWHMDPDTTGKWFDTGRKAVGFGAAALGLWFFIKDHAADAARKAAEGR